MGTERVGLAFFCDMVDEKDTLNLGDSGAGIFEGDMGRDEDGPFGSIRWEVVV